MLISSKCANVTRTIQEAIKNGEKEIVFEKGIYHFYPEDALIRTSYISNHDNDGKKCVGIQIEDTKDITIDGGNSKFIFHGIMLPMAIEHSKNIVIKNFSIDFPISSYIHSTVVDSGEDYCDIKLWGNTPYRMENNTPLFQIDGGYEFTYKNVLEFNSKLECIEYGTNDRDYFTHSEAEELSSGLLRIRQKFHIVPRKGNYMFFCMGQRFAPAIFINSSETIMVENITIHHSLGMGLLAQLSKDIKIMNMNVTPSEGRFVSAYADAIHFVECSGDILIHKCHFEKQMDDFLNCHGIYARVTEIHGDEATLQLCHHQALGMLIFSEGERVEYINSNTLAAYGENVVEKAWMHNSSTIKVKFKNPISVKCGDYLENVSHAPNLTVSRCKFGKNRARGLLITTRGKVLVQNNVFEKTGAAVRISADCNFWFESGCVRDVTIKNNTFIDLNANSRWGNAVIDIVPQVMYGSVPVHKNIRIENNTFRTFDTPLLWANCTDGIVFKNNKIERTNTFKPKGLIDKPVTLVNCQNTDIVI